MQNLWDISKNIMQWKMENTKYQAKFWSFNWLVQTEFLEDKKWILTTIFDNWNMLMDIDKYIKFQLKQNKMNFKYYHKQFVPTICSMI